MVKYYFSLNTCTSTFKYLHLSGPNHKNFVKITDMEQEFSCSLRIQMYRYLFGYIHHKTILLKTFF